MNKSMTTHKLRLLCLTASLALLAQEGHPLTGTWTGDWGSTAAQRNHITLVMNWDGKTVSGILNPGPNATPVKEVFVDFANWTVRFEADGKDASGAAVHIAAEGKLEDMGSIHRKLSGTWRQGNTQGDFKIARD
jgi:hypothetical protein